MGNRNVIGRGWFFACAALMAPFMLALQAGAQPPPVANYSPKPGTWSSFLVGNGGQIKDSDFADWVEKAQADALLLPGGARTFTFIATFTQCFSGGFITEIDNKAVTNFGANAACRYFEAASYDMANTRSYYSFAWSETLRLNPAFTDRDITVDAELKLRDGVAAIPDNPNLGDEAVQYLVNAPGGIPPEGLNVAKPKFAILYVGIHDPKDLQDLEDIYAALITVGYLPANIHVLYGDVAAGVGLPGSALTSDGIATSANLENAFTAAGGFLQTKLAAMPVGAAQVYFWSGDHGNFETPISFSVHPASNGVAGSPLNVRKTTPLPVEDMVYEGGQGTNALGWQHPVAGTDIDAISFGNDRFPLVTIVKPGIYFSVTDGSAGMVGSDVARMRNPAAAPPMYSSPDVFVKTQAQTRQGMDGRAKMALFEGPAGPPPPDDLNALTFGKISTVLDAGGALTVPLFFSEAGSAQIKVADPKIAGGPYVWWDPVADPNFIWALPAEIDAIAIKTAFVRDGVTKKLILALGDKIMYSTGPADPSPCSLYTYEFLGAPLATTYGCGALGLLVTDDVNALAIYDKTGPGCAPKPEDIDKNGTVDVLDLIAFLVAWGVVGVSDADFNNDGIVDVLDLIKLLAAWGEVC